MSTEDEPTPQPFGHSLTSATARADREAIDDIGTLLMRQVAMLDMLGRFLSIDYRKLYEAEQAEGWLKLVLYTEALYQQLHATVTTAAVLVGERARPPLSVSGLAQLDSSASEQNHPVAAELGRRRRKVDLLRWLLQVRNTAIQHRAEAGYVGSRGVVLPEAFALINASTPLRPAVRRKANDLFVGLHRRYGNLQQARVESREIVTYLDLFSHSILETAPSDFDAARRVVVEARAFDVVVSRPMLRNADTALAALIEIAPEHMNRVGAAPV
jgi:hypothetical protein